jgi:hypothetical protein
VDEHQLRLNGSEQIANDRVLLIGLRQVLGLLGGDRVEIRLKTRRDPARYAFDDPAIAAPVRPRLLVVGLELVPGKAGLIRPVTRKWSETCRGIDADDEGAAFEG